MKSTFAAGIMLGLLGFLALHFGDDIMMHLKNRANVSPPSSRRYLQFFVFQSSSALPQSTNTSSISLASSKILSPFSIMKTNYSTSGISTSFAPALNGASFGTSTNSSMTVSPISLIMANFSAISTSTNEFSVGSTSSQAASSSTPSANVLASAISTSSPTSIAPVVQSGVPVVAPLPTMRGPNSEKTTSVTENMINTLITNLQSTVPPTVSPLAPMTLSPTSVAPVVQNSSLLSALLPSTGVESAPSKSPTIFAPIIFPTISNSINVISESKTSPTINPVALGAKPSSLPQVILTSPPSIRRPSRTSNTTYINRPLRGSFNKSFIVKSTTPIATSGPISSISPFPPTSTPTRRSSRARFNWPSSSIFKATKVSTTDSDTSFDSSLTSVRTPRPLLNLLYKDSSSAPSVSLNASNPNAPSFGPIPTSPPTKRPQYARPFRTP